MNSYGNTIDDKIVKIKFDNSEFDKNIESSRQCLDKFDSRLKDLEKNGSSKTFDELNRSADELNSGALSQIGKTVEDLGEKFTAFGVIGKRVLEDLTDKAIDLGEKFVKSLSIDQISEGWRKYEGSISGVQKSISALSSTFEDATDEDLQWYIGNQMKQLTWFADETAYSLSQMSNTYSSFISSGVKDPEKVVSAIEGIAMAAAAAGTSIQNSEGVFNAWTKVISGGQMRSKTYDMLTVTNKGMDVNLKQAILDAAVAAGTLEDLGDGLYASSKNTFSAAEGFKDALEDGFATTDVVLDALANYGEVADRLYELYQENGDIAANNLELIADDYDRIKIRAWEAAGSCTTFADAVDAVKDAVSTQFKSIWSDIFGSYTEAKELWSEFCENLYEMFVPVWSFLKQAFDVWRDYGGRDLLFAMREIDEEGNELVETGGALWDILDAISSVFNAVIDGLGRVSPFFNGLSKLNNETGEFKDNLRYVAAAIKLACYRFKEFTMELIPSENILEGIRSSVAGVASVLKVVFKVAGLGLKVGFNLLMNIARALEPIFTVVTWLGGKLSNLSEGPLAYIIEKVYSFIDAVTEFSNGFITDAIIFLINIFDKLWPVIDGVTKVFESMLGVLTKIGGSPVTGGLTILEDILNTIYSLYITYVGPVLDWLVEKLDWVATGIQSLTGAASDGVDNLFGLFNKAKGSGKNTVDGFTTGIADGIADVKDAAVNMGKTFLETTEEKLDINSPSRETFQIAVYCILGFIDGLHYALKELIKVVGTIVKDVVDLVMNIIYQALDALGQIKVNELWSHLRPFLDILWETTMLILGWLLEKIRQFPVAEIVNTIMDVINKVMPLLWNVLSQYIMIKLGFSVKDLVDSLSSLISGLKTAVLKPFEGSKTEKTVDVIKAFAQALLMIAGACLVLSFLDRSKLANATAAIASLIIVLTGAIISITSVIGAIQGTTINMKQGLTSDKLGTFAVVVRLVKAIGMAVLEMSAGMALIAFVMSKSGLTTADMWSIAGMIGVMIAVITGITISFAVFSKKNGLLTKSSLDKMAALTTSFSIISNSTLKVALSLAIVALATKVCGLTMAEMWSAAAMITVMLVSISGILTGIMFLVKTRPLSKTQLAVFDSLVASFTVITANILIIAFALRVVAGGVAKYGDKMTEAVIYIAILLGIAFGALAAITAIANTTSTSKTLVSKIAFLTGAFTTISMMAVVLAGALITVSIAIAAFGGDTVREAMIYIGLMLAEVAGILTILSFIVKSNKGAGKAFIMKIAAITGGFMVIALSIIPLVYALYKVSSTIAIFGTETVDKAFAMIVLLIAEMAIVMGVLAGFSKSYNAVTLGVAEAGFIALAICINILAVAIEKISGIVQEQNSANGIWAAVGVISVLLAVSGGLLVALSALADIFPMMLPIVLALAPAMIALGISVVLMANALVTIATNLNAIVEGFTSINFFKLLAFGADFILISFDLLIGGIFLSLAGPALIVGALGLWAFYSAAHNCLFPMMEEYAKINPWPFIGSFTLLCGSLLIGGIFLSLAGPALIVGALSFWALYAAVVGALIPMINALNAVGGKNILKFAAELLAVSASIFLSAGMLSVAAIPSALALLGMLAFEAMVVYHLIPMIEELYNRIGWDQVGKFAGVINALAAAILIASVLLGVASPFAGLALAGSIAFHVCFVDHLIPALKEIAEVDWNTVLDALARMDAIGFFMLVAAALLGPAGVLMVLASPGLYIGSKVVQSAVIPMLNALAKVEWDTIKNAAFKFLAIAAALSVGAALMAPGLILLGVALVPLAAVLVVFAASVLFLALAFAAVMIPFNQFISITSELNAAKLHNFLAFVDELPGALKKVAIAFKEFFEELSLAAIALGSFVYTCVTQICDAISKSSTKIAKTILDLIVAISAIISKHIGEITTLAFTILFEIIKGVATFLSAKIPDLAETLCVQVTSVAEKLAALIKGPKGQALKKALVDFFDTIYKWINDPEFQSAWNNFLNSVKIMLQGMASKMYDWGYSIGEGFMNGLKGGFDSVVINLAKIIADMIPMDWIELAHTIHQIDDKTYSTLKLFKTNNGSSTATSTDWSNVKFMDANGLPALTLDDKGSYAQQAMQFQGWYLSKIANQNGQYTVEGYTEAFNYYTGYGAGKSWGKGVIDGTRKVLGIESPSKEFIAIGEYSGEGYEIGLADQMANGEIEETARRSADSFSEAWNDEITVETVSMTRRLANSNANSTTKTTTTTAPTDTDDWLTNVKNAASNLWGKVKDFFSEAWTVIQDTFGWGDGSEGGSSGGGIQGWLAETFGLATDDNGNIDFGASLTQALGLDSIDGYSVDDILGEYQGFESDYDFGIDTSDFDESAASAGAGYDSTSTNKTGSGLMAKSGANYTIVQNNYSPKSLNATEIYRRTKTTFSKLEGVNPI